MQQEKEFPAYYYDFEAGGWEKKPTPPIMRNVQIGSKGEVGFSFNEPVIFPPSYKRKFLADKAKIAKRDQQRRLKGASVSEGIRD